MSKVDYTKKIECNFKIYYSVPIKIHLLFTYMYTYMNFFLNIYLVVSLHVKKA